MQPPSWHGTPEELQALSAACAHNCGCVRGMMGMMTQMCEPHQGMQNDQHWLDRLVFERRRLQALEPDAGKRVVEFEGEDVKL